MKNANPQNRLLVGRKESLLVGSSRVGTGGAIATLGHTRMERMQVMRGGKGIGRKWLLRGVGLEVGRGWGLV